jgi:hypothetical protein
VVNTRRFGFVIRAAHDRSTGIRGNIWGTKGRVQRSGSPTVHRFFRNARTLALRSAITGSVEIGQVYALVQQNFPQLVAGGAIVRSIARWGWKYVADRHRHDPASVVEAAAKNAADFSFRVSDKVRASIEAEVIREEQVEAALNQPGFVTLLQQAVLNASETASEFNHEQLARIVVARLQAPTESSLSIALRIAAEKVHDLTDQQLKILGLIFTCTTADPDFEVTGNGEADLARYGEMCQAELAPFESVELNNLDLQQIESLNLISIASFAGKFARFSGSEVTRSIMASRFGFEFQGTLLNGAPAPAAYQRLNRLMANDPVNGRIGISGVKLLSIGWLVGYSVYAQMRGVAFDLSGWK